MTTTARDLVEAYKIAQQATTVAAQIASQHTGNATAYPALAALAAIARDHYAQWADALGRNAVKGEIRDLARIMRDYLDTLPDCSIINLASKRVEHAGHVSTEALRFILNSAYPDDDDRKRHITDVAARRNAEQCG